MGEELVQPNPGRSTAVVSKSVSKLRAADTSLAWGLTRAWVRIFILFVSADIEPEITGQRK